MYSWFTCAARPAPAAQAHPELQAHHAAGVLEGVGCVPWRAAHARCIGTAQLDLLCAAPSIKQHITQSAQRAEHSLRRARTLSTQQHAWHVAAERSWPQNGSVNEPCPTTTLPHCGASAGSAQHRRRSGWARAQESSAPSAHCTRKSRVPFSHGRSSSSAAGATSSNRQAAQPGIPQTRLGLV
jgi:hypothetical protein